MSTPKQKRHAERPWNLPSVRGVHATVLAEIGRKIVGGELAPGSALPSEADLCTAFGISRTALREALRVLASKGLVRAKQKIGTTVTPADHWNYLDSQVLSWGVASRGSTRLIEELYELRSLIEPLAAALAAQHATVRDISALEKAYDDMEVAGDDGERVAEPDVRFHRGIIAASGNRLFSSLAHAIGAALAVNFHFVRDAPRGHAFLLPAHKKILDAIKDRDVNAARVAMQRLIEVSQSEARAIGRGVPARVGQSLRRRAVARR